MRRTSAAVLSEVLRKQCLRQGARSLSGTTDLLPQPVEAWEMTGIGRKGLLAKGKTEDEYMQDNTGCRPDDIVGYLEGGDDIIIDEEWAVGAETYAEVYVSLHKKLMETTDRFERKRLIELINRVDGRVLVNYPNQQHLDELHDVCMRDAGPVTRSPHWKRRKDRIATFHEWCFSNYPPKYFSSLPVSEMIALKDSYIKYLRGYKVEALSTDIRAVEGAEEKFAGHRSFFYHPMHNVRLVHPSVVHLMEQRLRAGKNLTRVSRVLETQARGGLLSLMLLRHGAAKDKLMMTHGAKNSTTSAMFNLLDVPEPKDVSFSLPENVGLQSREGQRGKRRKRISRRVTMFETVQALPRSDYLKKHKFDLVMHTTPFAGETLESTHVRYSLTEKQHPDLLQKSGNAKRLLEMKALAARAEGTDQDEVMPVEQICPALSMSPQQPMRLRSYAAEKDALMSFFGKMDKILKPNGRIVVFLDNCASIVDGKDPLTEILSFPDFLFEAEDTFVTKAGDHTSFCPTLTSEKTASMKEIIGNKKYKGVRRRETIEEVLEGLPPGNLRQKILLDRMKVNIAGGKLRRYTVKNCVSLLTRREIDELNAMPYIPEVKDTEAPENLVHGKPADELSKELNTRLVILKRKTDSDYRHVDLGQKRASEQPMDEGDADENLDHHMGYVYPDLD